MQKFEVGMDPADPQNRSEWRGRLRERLVKKPTLGRGKQGTKMDMMMMMKYSSYNIMICRKTYGPLFYCLFQFPWDDSSYEGAIAGNTCFISFFVTFFIPHHTKSGGVLCYTLQTF